MLNELFITHCKFHLCFENSHRQYLYLCIATFQKCEDTLSKRYILFIIPAVDPEFSSTPEMAQLSNAIKGVIAQCISTNLMEKGWLRSFWNWGV